MVETKKPGAEGRSLTVGAPALLARVDGGAATDAAPRSSMPQPTHNGGAADNSSLSRASSALPIGLQHLSNTPIATPRITRQNTPLQLRVSDLPTEGNTPENTPISTALGRAFEAEDSLLHDTVAAPSRPFASNAAFSASAISRIRRHDTPWQMQDPDTV